MGSSPSTTEMSIPISDSIIFKENLTHIEKVTNIKDFISRLEKAKEDLLNDSCELKKNIEEAVGIQLSNLRLRELQMWRQVDALIGHQNLLIQEELCRLHFLLGSYKVASSFVEDGKSLQGLDLVDMLFKSLKSGSLQKLNFKVDHEALQSAIQCFGKLEPQSDSGTSGMLLLPAEEDYEDGDHHVLYKSVKDQRSTEEKSVPVLSLISPQPPKSDSSGESFEILDGDEIQNIQCESNLISINLNARLNEVEELKSCCGCQSTSDVEIENLDELSCSSNHHTLPINKWLRSSVSTCTSNIPPAALVAKGQALVPPVEAICKANEKCTAFSNCICDENCMVSNLKEQIGHMELTDHVKYSPVYLKETVNNIIQKNYLECDPREKWLSSVQENNSKGFLDSLNTASFYDGWLSMDYFKSPTMTVSSKANSLSVNQESENSWLSDSVFQKSPSISNAVKNPWLSRQNSFEKLHKPSASVREMFLPYLKPTDTSKWLIKKSKDKNWALKN